MTEAQHKKTIVIGGGVAGLVATYTLGKVGLPVTLIESSKTLGGLASSFEFDGETIERFYHFLCKTDEDYLNFLEELGISEMLRWETGITSFFYEGALYRFATPFDLISFKPVPLMGRIRFGLNVIRDRFRQDWDLLDLTPASEWLVKQIGQSAYDVIWDPLIRIKFGSYHDQISAAWVWHRIHRVARSRKKLWEPEQLGYLQGGTQTLIDELEKKINKMSHVTIRKGEAVSLIQTKDNLVKRVHLKGKEIIQCSSLISTIALDQLKTIVDNEEYRDDLDQYTYIGVICGLLKLEKPVTTSFWVNINDHNIPFNGIIEYTNLNSQVRTNNNASYIYIPHYLMSTDPRFKFSNEHLMEEYIAGIKRVNPEFDRSWIMASNISRRRQAQAICRVGFKDDMPSMRSPIRGLIITDSTLYYPEDRTISASIRLGKQAAEMVIKGYGNEPTSA